MSQLNRPRTDLMHNILDGRTSAMIMERVESWWGKALDWRKERMR